MDGPIGEPVASDFVTIWRTVMQDPIGFFATMPEQGGLADPSRFLLTCAALNAAGAFLVSWSPFQALGVFVVLIVGTYALTAAITLVAQQLLDGRAGFEPVFRAVAYGSAPAAFFWVPFLASVPVLYAWYLQVRGIERVQSLDAGRAALATTLGWIAVWLVVRGVSCEGLAWIGTR